MPWAGGKALLNVVSLKACLAESAQNCNLDVFSSKTDSRLFIWLGPNAANYSPEKGRRPHFE